MDKWPAWTFRQERAYAANLGLHDIAWHFGDVVKEFGLDEADTVFVPYWNDGGLARHEHKDLYVSAWKRKGTCLALVVNVGTNRIEAAVQLDPAAMGLGATPPDAVAVRDVDSTLLRYFDEDATTTETPELTDRTLDDMLTGGMDPEALHLDERPEDLPPDERRAQDPDGKYAWQDGVLRCPVRRHDYRLFLFRTDSMPTR